MEAAWLAIMSTFTLLLCGDVHTARTGARLPGCSLLLSLSLAPSVAQAGRAESRELSPAQLQLSEPAWAQPAPAQHSGYGGQDGEHVIF